MPLQVVTMGEASLAWSARAALHWDPHLSRFTWFLWLLGLGYARADEVEAFGLAIGTKDNIKDTQ